MAGCLSLAGETYLKEILSNGKKGISVLFLELHRTGNVMKKRKSSSHKIKETASNRNVQRIEKVCKPSFF